MVSFPEAYFNSVAGVIATLGPTFRVTGWSAGAERFSGYSAGEAIGKNWWGFAPVEFHPQAALQAVTLRECGELQLQQPFLHRDGRLRWLEAMVVSLTAGSDGFLLLGRDVSRLRAGAGELTAGWKGLVEAVSDGALAVDEAGRVVMCNEALAQMLGLARAEVNGHLLANTPALLAVFRSAMAGTPGRPLELTAWRADGAAVPLTTVASTVEVNGQRLALAVFRAPAGPVATPDTAMFQADKNRAISLLSRGVAHDFNNLFAAILAHLDLVRTAVELPAGLRENLELAQAGARRGADLVGKLQTFSSQAAPRLEPMDLRGWVAEVFALLRRSLGTDANVRLAPPAEGLWPVRGDGNQILQVLLNLCLIAREAVSRAGEIVIRVENVAAKQPPKAGGAGDFVALAVAGLGPGHSVAALGALTARASDGLDGAKNGGLGLSIADNICAGHGGWLEVERRAGVGTEFRMFLPRVQPAEGPPGAETSAPWVATGGSVEGTETILVVDDESSLRMLMRAVLSYRGYQIITAGSGEEAVEKYAAATTPIGAVLMDLNLPGMSGWEAMAKLRARNPRLPVVVLSGGYAEEEARRAKSLGAADFVSKPFDNLDLVQTVRRVLDAAASRG